MTVVDAAEAEASRSATELRAAPEAAPFTAPALSGPALTAPALTAPDAVGSPSRLMSILLRVGRALAQYPWLVAPLVCVLPLALHLTGSDTPAESYRVWLFHHFGFTVWNTQWYGGHTVLGYSVLFPPLAAVFGSGTVGLVSCTVAARWVTLMVRRETGRPHTLAMLVFSGAVVENLIVGRTAFSVGLAFMTLAMLQVSLEHRRRALIAATLTSLASPLAGFFLILVALAWWKVKPLRSLLPLGGAMIGAIAVLMFPENGTFPFPLSTLLAVLGVSAVGLLFVPKEHAVIRRALWIYGLTAIPLFVVANPIGGNLARPGSLLAVPVALIALRRRKLLAAVALVPLLIWHFEPIVPAIANRGDPAARPAFYAGLLDYLKAHDEPLGRLEIPFTRSHWEARYVAPAIPLARGWERQLDIRYNAILYNKDQLNQSTYREWLVENGVRWVALPNEPLDPSSQAEAKVINSSPGYLKPVWHDANWQLWEVQGSDGLTTGPATMLKLTADTFTLNFSAPGNVVVRIHSNPYWSVVGDASACINSTAEGWTSVTSAGTGIVTVTSKWSLGGGDVARPAEGGCLPPTPAVSKE